MRAAADAIAENVHQDYSCDVWGIDMRNCGLSAQGRASLCELLEEYFDHLFSDPSSELGCLGGVEMSLDNQGIEPIKLRPYGESPTKRDVIDAEIKRMLEHGVIRPSKSPWASPVFVLPKPDGGYRFCVDYRQPNSVTKGDTYRSLLMSELIELMGSSRYFSSLDLTSGYWKLPVREEDKEKTAFVGHRGVFEFNRMPFGLKNAPPSSNEPWITF